MSTGTATRASSRIANVRAQKKIQSLIAAEDEVLTDVPLLKSRRAICSEEVSDLEEDSTTDSSKDDSKPQPPTRGVVGDAQRQRKRKRQSKDDIESEADSEGDGLCEYERRRLRNIRENMAMMASLNLLKAKDNFGAVSRKPPRVKREKKSEPIPLQPSRRSVRLQGITPEGIVLPQTSALAFSVAEEKEEPLWLARQPSGPLKMTCLCSAMQAQEEVFRGEMMGLVQQAIPEAVGTANMSVQPDRGEIYSKLRLKQVQKVTPKRIYSLEFHPMNDKTIVAVGDTCGHLGVWDVEAAAGDHVYLYQPHTRVISSLVFSRSLSAPVLYSCSYDGTLRAADFATGVFTEVYATVEDHDLCLTSCDLNVQSDWLVVSQGDGSVVQVDLRADKNPVNTWKCHEKWIKTVQLNPADNNFFVSASKDCTVAIWDVRKITGLKSCLQRVRHSRSVSSAYFSPLSGKKLLTTSLDNCIHVLQSMGGCGAPVVTLSVRHHNNQTGRWLTNFRARWDPSSEKYFTVGSMAPIRQIEIHSAFSSSKTVSFVLRDKLLASVCSLTAIHPGRPVLCGANSSGRVYYWK